MGIIKKLPQNLVNLIAAGEVVERPASALKELMENAIDAKSDKIIVKIENAGLTYIQVEDNGTGMNKDDAQMAFEQHATSKILTEEDLNKIYTLGFRGEALASISSVCQELSIETKGNSSEAIKFIKKGSNLNLEPSNKTHNGTIVRIEGLFENIPARKKFLKSEKVELKHLAQTFINTALPSLNIHFELWHNQKEIYKLTKVTSFKDRIFEIWGNNISKHIFEPIEYSTGGFKLNAYLGSTEIGRKSGDIQYTFVNGRCINNKTIYQAAQEGYRGFLHRDLKPTYFYFLEVDPAEVDVNIHPRKNEVRFNNSQQIFQTVYSLTKKSLESSSKQLITENITSGQASKNSYEYIPRTKPTQFQSSPSNSGAYSGSSYIPVQRSRPTIQDALSFTRLLVEKNDDSQSAQINNYSQNLNPFQIFNTYLVFEKEDKVIFIDQHAAAEKIIFEKLYQNFGSIKTKPMLFGEVVTLKKHEKIEILARKAELAKSGIIIEDFGGDTIQVLEIPEIIEKIDITYYIHEILNPTNEFEKTYNKEEYNNLTLESYILLATEACHGSIRAGQKLSTEEMKRILADLLLLKNPYNCPHGRPVMWELDREDIEKNFKRKL